MQQITMNSKTYKGDLKKRSENETRAKEETKQKEKEDEHDGF